MSQFVPEDFAPSQPTIVTADTPCRKCGYNLRGLSPGSLCPECGTPIAVSVSGDLLQFCEPTWVRLLARGTKLIVAGVMVIFLGLISFMIAAIALRISIPQVMLFFALTLLAAYTMIVIGSWWLTTPDPSGIGEDRYGTARKIIRIALVIGVGNAIISLPANLTALPPVIAQALALIGELVSVIGLVGLIAQLQYFEKLGERIPDRQLSARARFLKGALPACCLVIIGNSIIVHLLAGNGTPPNGAGTGVGCFMGLVAIAALIFALMYLLMIDKFGKRFKEQAFLAARNWAAHVAVPEAK